MKLHISQIEDEKHQLRIRLEQTRQRCQDVETQVARATAEFRSSPRGRQESRPEDKERIQMLEAQIESERRDREKPQGRASDMEAIVRTLEEEKRLMEQNLCFL